MVYPPVTVLIPAYNAASTIERALDSVWRQNYPEMEVIVVDDASTDQTGLILEEAASAHLSLRLFRLQGNRGVSGALNAGIQQARTDYIAFLDADDEWLADKLAKQIPIIATRPKMTLIACGEASLDAAGRDCGTFGLELDLLPYVPGEFWRALLFKCYFSRTTVVARRSKLLEVGGFDETLKVSEDQDMWIKLASEGETGFVPEVLARIHHLPNSLGARYGEREAQFTLPMIRNHLLRLASRLSRREKRLIIGQRYAATGRNIYALGRHGWGAALVIRGALLGNRPLENLAYLVSAAPPMIRLKERLRRKSRVQDEDIHGGDQGRADRSGAGDRI
jgi:glycosyltransferase involved in cell wall biosynthesis